jgi:hypothetical protein
MSSACCSTGVSGSSEEEFEGTFAVLVAGGVSIEI